MKLHAFGLRAIGVAIVSLQAGFGVFCAYRIHGVAGAVLGVSLGYIAGQNATALCSWWRNP